MPQSGGVIEEDIVEFIQKRNAEQSIAFTDPSAQAARRLYRRQHPTEILVMKCMDGRLNLSIYTEIPPGILQPFRNIGGKFNLGWPYFQDELNDMVDYAISKARQCLIISSYHFSKGDHHRGCAGFGYDTHGAQEAAFKLRDELTYVYGSAEGRPVYALTVGIETDDEALIFHGQNGKELKVSDLKSTCSTDDIVVRLKELYPDMNSQMIMDIVPLVEGNIHHIGNIHTEGREPIDLEHREQVIAVGRGFDWLHLPNTALIIGPFSHGWPDAVRTAGTIIKGNLDAGRIPPEHGVLLLISALYRQEEGSAVWRLKEQKAKYLLQESQRVLSEGVPELVPHLRVLAGVVNADTRKFHPLP